MDRFHYEYAEYAGYDCTCPGVMVKDGKRTLFTIDATDHGWNVYGAGASVVDHHESVRLAIIKLAKRIVAALNAADWEDE